MVLKSYGTPHYAIVVVAFVVVVVFIMVRLEMSDVYLISVRAGHNKRSEYAVYSTDTFYDIRA